MSELSRAEYRSRVSRTNASNASKDKPDISGSYVKIITLQLFLCILILLSVVALKQFSNSTYDTFKQSYNEIISESYTGKVLSENFESIKGAVSETFSFLEQKEDDKTGMGGEMPVFSIDNRELTNGKFATGKRMKAPKGAMLSPIFVFTGVLFPIEGGGTISSPYGYRIHPITGKADFHTGIDIAAPRGTRVMAAIGGTVKEISYTDIDGYYIVLDHGNSLATIYCHCDKILAPLGARIKRGETIALVGSTGLATGPHLHFEIKHHDVFADPMWIFGREEPNAL